MKRPWTALPLILVFLATLFAPLRTGWACPDGTPCVVGAGSSFVCAGGRCATEKSCCEVDRPVECRHGAFPAKDPPGSAPRVGAPDRCQFSVSAPPVLVAVLDAGGSSCVDSHDVPCPPVVAELPVLPLVPAWRSEYTLGCRPPPALSQGSPRAPPAA